MIELMKNFLVLHGFVWVILVSRQQFLASSGICWTSECYTKFLFASFFTASLGTIGVLEAPYSTLFSFFVDFEQIGFVSLTTI